MQSRRAELGTTKGTMKVAKVATSGVARVSRRAVSAFAATYPCSTSLQHGQRRRRRPSRSGGVNTRESNEIAPVMWGVVTRVRPAPSTQTIENKRTILRHRARGPRKTEISPYLVIHFTLVMHADMSGHEPAWMPGVIRRENPGDSIDFAQRFAIKHGRPDAPDRGLPPRRRRYTSANVSTR